MGKVVIRMPYEEPEICEFDFADESNAFDEIKEAIKIDYAEFISPFANNKDKELAKIIMIIDEEGKLKENPVPNLEWNYIYDPYIVGGVAFASTTENKYGELVLCGLSDKQLTAIHEYLEENMVKE